MASPGECDRCEEWHPDLRHGLCPPCADDVAYQDAEAAEERAALRWWDKAETALLKRAAAPQEAAP
jgi:hypothetical protein